MSRVLHLERISSLGDALADACVLHKSQVALIEADRHREKERWTYREVRDAALRVAGSLQRAGVDPGDRVAIAMSNQSRWLVSAIGAMWAGAVLVPVDYKLSAKEQRGILAHAEPHIVIAEWPVWRDLRDGPRLGETEWSHTVKEVWVTEAPERDDVGPGRRWAEAIADAGELRPVSRDREDVASIVYSSGTGGRPKGCMLTHGNYLAQAQSLAALYPMAETDRYFSILPTNHAIDFMCGFLLPLMFGASIVHQRTLRPQFLAPTMKRYGITHMAVVPRILTALEERFRERIDDLPDWRRTAVHALASANALATMKKPNHTLSRTLLAPLHAELGGKLKFMFCGGAFTPRETAEFFYRIGIPVAIGYGLTEAGTVLTVNDLKPFRGDTVGRPVEGVDVELRDVNDDRVGEVWVRGPTIMQGYFKEPGLTDEAIVDGWLRTGDLGTIDASGHLKLLGRARNMIVTEGGKNVYPEDVESSIGAVDGVEELAVFATPYVFGGGLEGETLMVAVRLADDGDAGEVAETLRARNRALAEHKRIGHVLWWADEFPRTASLKVKRRALAEALRDQSSRDDLKELGT